MPGTSAASDRNVVVASQEQLKALSQYVLRESAAGEVRSTLNIGRYLFTQLFRASEEAFRCKNSKKPDSLNALAGQPRMKRAKWSRTRLRNSIELSLMAKVLNDFRAWRFLTVSHYEEVIGLPVDRQRELLDQADKEQWSVRDLSDELEKQNSQRPVAAAGSVAPQEALRQIRKAMGQVAALADPKAALSACLVEAGIDAKAAAKFASRMKEDLGMLEGFQKQLEEMKKRSESNLKVVAGKVAAPG
ncbi:MAG TPA: hypothetical protein VGK67_01140 [Myxococcales bacterium]|jgi:hypothetical protein